MQLLVPAALHPKQLTSHAVHIFKQALVAPAELTYILVKFIMKIDSIFLKNYKIQLDIMLHKF